MSASISIQVKNLSKAYKLYDRPVDRLKESLNPFRKKYHKDFYALSNINFDVKKGESIGIIGKNGSGKSTLLKILTGVLSPTAGTVSINGKVSALLELGAAFNPEMTGIENVYFSGTVMGYTKNEMDAKLDDILSFADIGEFVRQPVKTYSSGMFVRLAFASAISVDPDILIIDEALSVGDIFFQQKCFSKIRQLIDSETTILFVTHSMPVMQNLCGRAILLENGIVLKDGDPVECASAYYLTQPPKQEGTAGEKAVDDSIFKKATGQISEENVLKNNILSTAKSQQGEKGLEIIAASFSNGGSDSCFDVGMFDVVQVRILLKAHQFVTVPNVGFSLFDHLNNLVFSTSAFQRRLTLPSLKEGEEIVVTFKIRFSIAPGEYTFALGCGEPDTSNPGQGHTHHRLLGLGPVRVYARDDNFLPFYGFAELPVEVHQE